VRLAAEVVVEEITVLVEPVRVVTVVMVLENQV
jgi:hypothetical protein